ncbi:MAG: ATP-binding cassette domain-containing protein [Bacteroides sp.]|nr:ATP-binding cassette domain-containing protein [Bacteroides sp.]
MEEIAMSNVLSVKNLSIQIKQRILIQNVSFDVGQGEAVLLSGENGIGKSSILKSIMHLETENKKIGGEITHYAFGDVLALSDEEIQRFRSITAYIPQKDEYSEMGRVQVRDIISNSGEAHSGRDMSYSEVNDLIDEWLPRRSDNSRIFNAKSKPSKFSGGEQRLLSVFSVIATRPNTDLLIVDEPLNNLDYVNARHTSNLINKVIRDNPKIGLLMISHCRIFPFITRELKLSSAGICKVPNHYVCHSCFGVPDENGFYK